MLAVLAPVAGAAVLYAVIGSPMMLAFAALSPVIAIAGAVDGRIAARRRRRADARTHAAESAVFLDSVSSAHRAERAALDAEHPSAAALLADASHRSRRWTAPSARLAVVRIGTGTTASRLVVSGSAEAEEDLELVAAACSLADAPILGDPGDGIGVVGPLPAARALVRGLVVQLAHAHPPGALALDAPDAEAYRWLAGYPHAGRAHAAPLVVHVSDTGEDPAGGKLRADAQASMARRNEPLNEAILAVAPSVETLPSGCRLVVRVEADGDLRMLSAAAEQTGARAELITAQQALGFGTALAAEAAARGIAAASPLAEHVELAELGAAVDADRTAAADAALPATFCVSDTGPLVIDLVASGPHAVVTGTTGSGKSELLTSWVLGIASAASPLVVNFLLVDFKGGTAFQRLAALPHTVGVVTDLGHGEALRALKSLRAEIRRREAELARRAASDLRDAPDAFPRLVIVVDEAAAMLAAFPDLAALFVDIAARGRALGMHLVLATQRATGVLGDALIANCALRISLRLSSEADSAALLGTDAAARLPHGIPGRLVVSRDGTTVIAQAASARDSDIESVVSRFAGGVVPRAPWLPALPSRIPLSAFGASPPDSVVIGARDDPDRQVQEGIVYRPTAAHLLVQGARGSGKSTVLAAVGAQWTGEVVVVPADVEGAWDALSTAAARPACDDPAPCLVLLDDVDALLERFDDEHRDAVVERIRALLIDGPRAGTALVCTASSLPSALRAVAGRFGERLVLRQSDRQEHVLAGAPAELYDADAPPGRGVWRERACQVVLVPPPPLPTRFPPPELEFEAGTVTVVVAQNPEAVLTGLAAADLDAEVIDVGAIGTDSPGVGDATSPVGVVTDRPDHDAGTHSSGGVSVRTTARAVVLVGDAETWQSRFGLLARVRSRAVMVFDGCPLPHLRALLHTRELPPTTVPGHVLVREPSGAFSRARMP